MKDGKFTDADLGAVLAGLRLWQHSLEGMVIITDDGDDDTPKELSTIASDDGSFEPLNADQIDELCDAINGLFIDRMNDDAAAERERIAKAIAHEAEICPCGEDASVLRDTAWLVRADFSYDEAEKLERLHKQDTAG